MRRSGNSTDAATCHRYLQYRSCPALLICALPLSGASTPWQLSPSLKPQSPDDPAGKDCAELRLHDEPPTAEIDPKVTVQAPHDSTLGGPRANIFRFDRASFENDNDVEIGI